MKKLTGLFLLLMFTSCTNSEIGKRAKLTAELMGVKSYSVGSEVYKDTNGEDRKKLKLVFNAVPDGEVSNKTAVRDFETRLIMFFYAGLIQKDVLNDFDGIDLKFTSEKHVQKSSYFSISELEKVLSEMKIVESVIDDMNKNRMISWNENFDMEQLDSTYVISMNRFLEEDFNDFGNIKNYYLEGYDIWNINSNLITVIKYQCETQNEKDLFIDFLVGHNSDKIIGMIAHQGDFEFSFN